MNQQKEMLNKGVQNINSWKEIIEERMRIKNSDKGD